MRVGDRVHLKNTTGMPLTEHGKQGDPTGVVHVQTFLVTETATELEVLWQDGTKESLKSVDVIPYLNPDEYDCWRVAWKEAPRLLPTNVFTGLEIMSYSRTRK